MRPISLHLLGVMVALLPSDALAQKDPSWLCVMDKVTGFFFEKGQWSVANFKSGEKFLVTKATDPIDGKTGYQWRDFGKEWGPACELNGSLMLCEFPAEVRFNMKTLRFLWSYRAGYIEGRDTNADTPTIGIGTCTPL